MPANQNKADTYSTGDLIADGKLSIGDGYRAKNAELSDSGLPFARAGNIDGGFHFVDADCFPECDLSKVGEKISQTGDVVFTSKGSVGRMAFVTEDTPRFVYAPQLCYWRSLDQIFLDSRWLYYWMLSVEFRHQMSGVKGQTDMADYVSLTDQRRMQITLPAIEEQRAIAGVLGSLDDKIEQNRRTAGKLEELARAVFRAWFVDFAPVHAKATPGNGATTSGGYPGLPQQAFDALPTTFQDSPLGPIPEGWEAKTIGEVVTIKGGGTPSTKNPDYWDGGTNHWTTPKDLSNLNVPVLTDTARKITQAGVDKISSGLLPVGTVLLSSRAPVGYLAIAAVPMAINQGYIAMICDGQLSPQFILRWTENSMDLIKGNASGTTFAEISKKNFRPLPVVVPPPAITQAFDEVTKPLFDLLVANVHESHKLAALRDYLLPRLLSGTVRIRGNNE